MHTPYSPAAVANNFLEKSGAESKPLTPMQLLKLVYIAHGWHLAVTGEPLFAETVQAWKHGPVVPSLFHEFKGYGGHPIKRLAHDAEMEDYGQNDPELVVSRPFVPETDADAVKILNWVWERYGTIPGWDLSEMTHRPGTPWSNAVEKMRADNPGCTWVAGYPILNDEIRRHYLDLWKTRYGGGPRQQ